MTECDSGLPEGEARCLAVWGGLSRHCRNGRERLAPGRGGLWGSPGAVGTAGTWPSRAGAHFFPRNGAPAGQAPVPARSNGVGKPPKRTLPSAAPRQPRQARPQKASRIWYHTAPPCTEADTPSLTNPNLA